MNAITMPTCFRPYPGELLYSWIIRLYNSNGYPTVGEFAARYLYYGEPKYSVKGAQDIHTDWPIFTLSSDELIGCCGLQAYRKNEYEIGFHLLPKFWRKGYAVEVASAVINYAFSILKTDALFAGQNPHNTASAKILRKLGFHYIGDEFYEPTGLYHPSYELKQKH